LRGLTERQALVISLIEKHIEANGYAPTLRELAGAMGIASTYGVNCHIAALEKKGRITRTKKTARSFRVLPAKENDV
jgi:repressor LexA